MKLSLSLLIVGFLGSHFISNAAPPQGPSGEIVRKTVPPPPPPVDEKAASRAALAAHQRHVAAIRDQYELALQEANDAAAKYRSNYSQNDLLSSQSFSESEAAYKRASKLSPNDWRAYVGLGTLYTPYHNDEAAVAYQRAADLKPNDLKLLNSLGAAYYSIAKFQEAVRPFEKSVQLDPSVNNEMTFESLAYAYAHLKLYDKAIAVLTRELAFHKEDDNGPVRYQMAWTYGEARKYDEAVQQYKLLLTHAAGEEEISSFKRLLMNTPQSYVATIADGYYAIGDMYFRGGKYSEAIPEFKEAIRQKPDMPIYYVSLGRSYYESKQYAEAMDSCSTAIKLDPKNASGHLCIGDIYGEQQDFDKAVEQLKQARALDSTSYQIVGELGAAYYMQKKYDLCVEPLQAAIRLRPEKDPFGSAVGLYYHLGLAQLQLGKKDEAMEVYQELKKSDLMGATSAADELLKQINNH